MIQFLEHTEINRKKWDHCIDGSPNGMVYANSWFLDVVSPGWNAIVQGDYESVFPLTGKKKYGINYLCQPDFTQQLGIFSINKNVPESLAKEIFPAIPEKYQFVEIQLNTRNNFAVPSYRALEKLTHHLDLSQSIHAIENAYSENLERNLKRAVKNNLSIVKSPGMESIITLFRKNRGRNIPFGNREYKMLNLLVQEAAKRKRVTLLGAASENNNLCAAAVFMESHHEYIFFFSGTDEEGKKSGAMSLIIDSFIRTHAGEKMILDFEGSMDKNLARFYKSFGSKEVVYLQIKKNTLPAYLRWIKK